MFNFEGEDTFFLLKMTKTYDFNYFIKKHDKNVKICIIMYLYDENINIQKKIYFFDMCQFYHIKMMKK